MYRKGQLTVGTALDAHSDYENVIGAYLPHSCGSWVIGGKEQVKLLIADLQNALITLEVCE